MPRGGGHCACNGPALTRMQRPCNDTQRDGCPKIVNLGSAKTDLFYERKKCAAPSRPAALHWPPRFTCVAPASDAS